MPLEDDQQDIIRKALANRGLSLADLPHEPQALDAYLRQQLGISPEAWRRIPAYEPAAALPPGLDRHEAPYPYGTVNIWTIDTPQGLIVVDTGCTPADLRAAIGNRSVLAILITHEHGDHIGGLASGWQQSPVYGIGSAEPPASLGGWTLRTVSLAGHTPRARGYILQQGNDTLLFTGDSLFAGSIGKIPGGEAPAALARIRAALAALPDNAVICPGHGPATTTGQELKNNPFLA